MKTGIVAKKQPDNKFQCALVVNNEFIQAGHDVDLQSFAQAALAASLEHVSPGDVMNIEFNVTKKDKSK